MLILKVGGGGRPTYSLLCQTYSFKTLSTLKPWHAQCNCYTCSQGKPLATHKFIVVINENYESTSWTNIVGCLGVRISLLGFFCLRFTVPLRLVLSLRSLGYLAVLGPFLCKRSCLGRRWTLWVLWLVRRKVIGVVVFVFLTLTAVDWNNQDVEECNEGQNAHSYPCSHLQMKKQCRAAQPHNETRVHL